MGSSKNKEDHNRGKPKKMKKKISKPNKKEIKALQAKRRENKEYENVFENNLTEPNEYSKGYQSQGKIHIPDLLPF